MSSFRRSAPAASESVPSRPTLPGTRRWVDGSLLTSTGDAALDGFLGGGLPLGSLVLIEEDDRDVHAGALAALFLAEGVACGHRVVLSGWHAPRALRAQLEELPANASRGGRDVVAAAAAAREMAEAAVQEGRQAQAAVALAATSAVGEEEDSDDADDGDEGGGGDATGAGLRIAWQYRKYLPPPPSSGVGAASAALEPGVDASRCGHSFDLGRRIHPRVLAASDASVISAREALGAGEEAAPPACCAAVAPAHSRLSSQLSAAACAPSYSRLYAQLSAAARAPPPGAQGGGLVRIFLRGLGGPAWPGASPADAPASGGPAEGPPEPDADALPPAGAWEAAAPMLRCVAALRELARSGGGGGAQEGEGEAPLARAPAARPPPCVVLITAPTQRMPFAVAARLRAMADCVLKAHAWGDAPASLATERGGGGSGGGGSRGAAAPAPAAAAEFAGYTGLLLLRRLPRTQGSVSGHTPDTPTLVLKRGRRRLLIERPHLPPEGEGGAQAAGSMGCASAGGQGESAAGRRVDF